MEVTIEPATLAVAPEKVGTATVTLRNTGSAAVSCALTVSGPVADWTWISPPSVEVPAGGAAAARLSLKVPPPPDPRAGKVPFEVIAGPDARCSAVVDVAAVHHVTAAIGPNHVLTVRNQGNVDETVALEAEGGASVTPESLSVAAGESATATISARRGRPVQVHVRPAGGTALTVTGAGERGGRGAPGRRRRLLRWPVLVPVVAVIALIGALLARGGGDSEPAPGPLAAGGNPTGQAIDLSGGENPNCPVQGHLAAEANGIKRVGLTDPDQWSFLEQRPGMPCLPVRFNPCEPVHYVTNSALAPAGALADLDAAFAKLTEATGMTFVNDGPSDEQALANRPLYQPGKYGQRWAPLLIIWDHGRPNRLASDNPGGGRSTAVSGVYVSGFLLLNVDAVDADFHALANGFGPGPTWGRVMIHELGHMMGLGHVRSPQEIMFSDLGLQKGQAEYHAGDLAGFKSVGKEAGCLQTPARPAN